MQDKTMSRLKIGSIVLLFASVVANAALAAAVSSSSVTGAVGISGTVANKCLFTTSNAVLNIGEMADISGQGAGVGHFDPTKLNSETAVLTGWCTGTAATISIEALPMLNTTLASIPSGFTNRVDYTASAKVSPSGGPVTVLDDSISAGGSSPQTVGVFAGDIDVAFSNAAAVSNALLVAGAYEGSVIVTLAPTT